MKKSNVLVHVVANVVIVAVIISLYFVCVPIQETAIASSAPIYKGDVQSNKVALMINVYEHPEVVEKMLAVLDAYGATATFFVGGLWVEKNAELLKRIAEKHEIGNHGYLHKDHAKLSLKQNEDEIMLCHKLVEKATGVSMKLFAPPSGSIGNNMLKVCKDNDYKVIMWTRDTIDWRDRDTQTVLKRATNGTQSGDMILMHPYEHTLKALPYILKALSDKGLKTATVSELTNLGNLY